MKAKLISASHHFDPLNTGFTKKQSWSLTDGPKQILAGAPDQLEGKPELSDLSRRGEGELPEAVVDAEVHLVDNQLP